MDIHLYLSDFGGDLEAALEEVRRLERLGWIVIFRTCLGWAMAAPQTEPLVFPGE